MMLRLKFALLSVSLVLLGAGVQADVCADVDCSGAGTCTPVTHNGVDSYFCDCNVGKMGLFCENDRCLPNGIFEDGNCVCNEGY